VFFKTCSAFGFDLFGLHLEAKAAHFVVIAMKDLEPSLQCTWLF